MIKVADIYVSEDGCGPYTFTVCGGADASYFKVIGKSLYFDEDKFATVIQTTTQTTTNPNVNNPVVQILITTNIYNSYKNCIGSMSMFNFGPVGAVVKNGNTLITNPQLSYQWQEQLNGTWTNISGAISSSLGNYNKFNYVRVIITYQNTSVISGPVRGYCSIV